VTSGGLVPALCASVKVEGEEYGAVAVPDLAGGALRCVVPARAQEATVSVRGYVSAACSIPPEGNQWTVSLDPGPRVEGVVRTSRGEPVANVDVFVVRGEESVGETTTDFEGRYRLGSLPDGEQVQVRAWAGHVRRVEPRWAYASRNPPGRLDFVVETCGAVRASWSFLSARVPLDSIAVSLVAPDGTRTEVEMSDFQISMGPTDAGWEATGLEAGRHRLLVSFLGREAREWDVDVVVGQTTFIDVTAPAGGLLVRAPEGDIPHGCRVAVRELRRDAFQTEIAPPEREGYLDSRGWRFDALVAGAYRLDVRWGYVDQPPCEVVIVADETLETDALPDRRSTSER
jgi:hypothetical protein